MHLVALKLTAPNTSMAPPVLKTKLTTSFSVAQLALFIRLMIDMKIIMEDNYTSLLKTSASVIATSKTNDISAESLRNNFYSPGKAAKEIMKEYLIGMLNLVKTY